MKLQHVLFVATLALLSGCIQKADVTSNLKTEQVSYDIMSIADTNTCLALICHEKTSWFGLFSSVNLSSGSCNFNDYNLLDKSKLKEFNQLLARKSGTDYVKMFMLGAGDRISDADQAKRLCNGRLGMALIDLGGYTNNPVRNLTDSDVSSLECLLAGDTIPIIAYGSAESGFANNLASALSGIGPVIVSPGFGYNTSNQISDPSPAFAEIKSKCSNCFTMAVMDVSDNSTIDHYTKAGALNRIDVIGFTLNVSAFSDCNPNTVEAVAKNFAEKVVTQQKRPSIIAGMYLREGQNYKGSCDWGPEDLASFYETMMISIPDLSTSGVIGMVGPGFSSLSSLPTYAYHSWYYGCSAYYDTANDYQTPAVFSLGGSGGQSLCSEPSILNTGIISQYTSPDDYSALPSSVDAGPFCRKS